VIGLSCVVTAVRVLAAEQSTNMKMAAAGRKRCVQGRRVSMVADATTAIFIFVDCSAANTLTAVTTQLNPITYHYYYHYW
jgi:hypothetical protein